MGRVPIKNANTKIWDRVVLIAAIVNGVSFLILVSLLLFRTQSALDPRFNIFSATVTGLSMIVYLVSKKWVISKARRVLLLAGIALNLFLYLLITFIFVAIIANY